MEIWMPSNLSENLTIIIYLLAWKIRQSVNELQMVLNAIPSTKVYKSAQTFFVVFLHKYPPISSNSNNQDEEMEHKTPISNSFIFYC